MYFDAAYAGKVATVVLIIAGLFVWVGAWLAVTTVSWDALAHMDERDRRDRFTPKEPYRLVNDEQEQIRALRRFDAALAAMDEPDEHELARYVG